MCAVRGNQRQRVPRDACAVDRRGRGMSYWSDRHRDMRHAGRVVRRDSRVVDTVATPTRPQLTPTSCERCERLSDRASPRHPREGRRPLLSARLGCSPALLGCKPSTRGLTTATTRPAEMTLMTCHDVDRDAVPAWSRRRKAGRSFITQPARRAPGGSASAVRGQTPDLHRRDLPASGRCGAGR